MTCQQNTCFTAPKISFLVLFLLGVRSEEVVKEIGIIRSNDHVNAVNPQPRQMKANIHERGWFGSKEKPLPLYYSYMKSINGTYAITDCETGGFSCVSFPSDVVAELASAKQCCINNLGTFSTRPLYDENLSTYEGPLMHVPANIEKLSAYFLKFSDPEWRKQWYMQDYRTENIPVMDHNVVPVFNMGITGKGVTIAIVGEGIKEHPDLGDSYDEDMSFNFCSNERGAIPYSQRFISGLYYKQEGNSNAGVIAMQPGNDICGVGIAPGAKIAGYRVSSCSTTNEELKGLVDRALEFQLGETDIYCNVWVNDALLTDGLQTGLIVPTKQAVQTLEKGAFEGRGYYGSIYIFSSGEHRSTSNCGCNGYLNNPNVITIASADKYGGHVSYSERCTAIMATAYSGDVRYEGVVTIDTYGKCSSEFVEASSASPAVASGIIALVLEANPHLTYRDVLHIITMTAEVAPFADNADTWYRNGRGFWVSNDFGFGLLNAENMVLLAQNWNKVPPRNHCVLRNKLSEPLQFDDKHKVEIVFDGTICNGESDITYLEHVVLEVTGEYYFRGAFDLRLTSPAGTTSLILETRNKDVSKEGFKSWNVMSVHNWGENPKGEWRVAVKGYGKYHIFGVEDPVGHIDEIVLKLYGTRTMPGNYPRKYSPFRLPSGKTNQYV